MSLQDTPRADRLHIGIFGRRNSGKSTLLNALTGQQLAVVSPVAGTTTDPVYKSMEIHGIGPVVIIDTAGFDDEGDLGGMRVEKTRLAAKKTDVALLVFSGAPQGEQEWLDILRTEKTDFIPVLNKSDEIEDVAAAAKAIEELTAKQPVVVSALKGEGIEKIREEIIRRIPEDYLSATITGDLVKEGDVVLLVMPQDIQAPKGRLILPQVQTLRELLDKKCIVMSCTTDKLEQTLAALAAPPDLIITDSQVFDVVWRQKPESSRLTSFSVLMAGYKGDVREFISGASAIEALTENSKVLIAEACTHVPLDEDIGREKIPRLLRKKAGQGLKVDVVAGADFPSDLSDYDLIVHCGACMFNRRYVLARIEQAKAQGTPITNYGVCIAYINGILDKIVYA